MVTKYICYGCENDDPCVIEIAMKADRMPTSCPWGDNADWEMMEISSQQGAALDAEGVGVSHDCIEVKNNIE